MRLRCDIRTLNFICGCAAKSTRSASYAAALRKACMQLHMHELQIGGLDGRRAPEDLKFMIWVHILIQDPSGLVEAPAASELGPGQAKGARGTQKQYPSTHVNLKR